MRRECVDERVEVLADSAYGSGEVRVAIQKGIDLALVLGRRDRAGGVDQLASRLEQLEGGDHLDGVYQQEVEPVIRQIFVGNGLLSGAAGEMRMSEFARCASLRRL